MVLLYDTALVLVIILVTVMDRGWLGEGSGEPVLVNSFKYLILFGQLAGCELLGG